MDTFRFDEKYLSQLPALQVLVNLGYQYLSLTGIFAGQWRLPMDHEEAATA